MITLYDIGVEITKIREAADSISVKGVENCRLAAYIFDKCNRLIEAINEVAQAQLKEQEEAEEAEEAEVDGEHTGPAE